MAKENSNIKDELNLDHISFEKMMKYEKNVYKAINIVAERAKDLNTKSTNNLHKLLEDFGTSPSDAGEICKAHDKKKKPHLEALAEYLEGRLEIRKKNL